VKKLRDDNNRGFDKISFLIENDPMFNLANFSLSDLPELIKNDSILLNKNVSFINFQDNSQLENSSEKKDSQSIKIQGKVSNANSSNSRISISQNASNP